MSDQNTNPPTLKTIAKFTRLSQSTVSLSLRDGSNLKQSMRDKVAQAAKQIGYVPNHAGVRLRTGRTNVLALVLSTDVKNLDFTRMLIKGIGAQIQGSNTVVEDLYSTGNALADLLIQSIDGASTDTLQILQEPIPNWRECVSD